MLVQSHDTCSPVEPQSLSLVGDTWATEAVPRLPADLAEHAHALKTFQRVQGLTTPPTSCGRSWPTSWAQTSCPRHLRRARGSLA